MNLASQLKGLCPHCSGPRPKTARACCCRPCFSKITHVRIPAPDNPDLTLRYACFNCPLKDRRSLEL